jgi:hypothetical protein
MALKLRVLLAAAVLLAIIGPACSATPITTSLPTLTPTSTPAPTPDSNPTPVVESRLAKTAFAYITALSESFAPRASTTPQEKAAAEYLESQFAALSYSATMQPFTVETFQSGLVVD